MNPNDSNSDASLVDEENDHLPALSRPESQDPTFYRHSGTRHREHIISNRDFFVLSLHLAGYSAEEIADLAGYASPQTVYSVLRRKEVLMVRQQMLEGLELEFEAMQKHIFDVIKSKVDSVDERIQLEAVQIWMRYFGKYKDRGTTKEELTAEDVVRNLLQVNVQVNVDGAK